MDYTLMSTASLETETQRLQGEIAEIERVIGTRVPPIGTLDDATVAIKCVLAKHGFNRPCHYDDRTLGVYEAEGSKPSVWRQWFFRGNPIGNESRLANAASDLLADESIRSWMKHFGFEKIRVMPSL